MRPDLKLLCYELASSPPAPATEPDWASLLGQVCPYCSVNVSNRHVRVHFAFEMQENIVRAFDALKDTTGYLP